MKKAGDTIEIGDTIGHPMEPARRYGRIVGIRKDNCKPIEQFIFREFTKEDIEKGRYYPTGKYRTSWMIVAYSPRSDYIYME